MYNLNKKIMKKVFKNCALVALGVIEVAVPVAALVMGCLVEGVSTFWCLLLIAAALAFLVIAGSAFVTAHRACNEFGDALRGIALLGGVGSLLLLAVECLWLVNTVKYFAAEPFNTLPMALSFWYLFAIMAVMLLTLPDWHNKTEVWQKVFMAGAVIFCGSIAVIGGAELLRQFGITVPEFIGEVASFVFAANIIVMLSALTVLLATVAANNYNDSLAARWCAGFGAIMAAGVVLLMLSAALGNVGINIPETLQEAFYWMFYAGPIGWLCVGAVVGSKKLLGK